MKIITIISLVAVLLISTVDADTGPVTQAVITTGVTSSARPQTGNLTNIDHRIGSVTFYTEIVGLQGKTVTHRWYYKGKEISSITLRLASARSLNWSRSSINIDQLGRWEARVVDSSGRVLASRRFSVVESGQSVQQIVEQKQVDSCSIKIANLKDKINENPDVKYYQFLYDKQVARCK